MHPGLARQLVRRDEPFRLGADVHEHAFPVDVDHHSAHDIAFRQLAECLVVVDHLLAEVAGVVRAGRSPPRPTRRPPDRPARIDRQGCSTRREEPSSRGRRGNLRRRRLPLLGSLVTHHYLSPLSPGPSHQPGLHGLRAPAALPAGLNTDWQLSTGHALRASRLPDVLGKKALFGRHVEAVAAITANARNLVLRHRARDSSCPARSIRNHITPILAHFHLDAQRNVHRKGPFHLSADARGEAGARRM